MGWQFSGVDVIFRFSKRSISSLDGVKPELVLLAARALEHSSIDFGITEGLRTRERQAQLFEDGKSLTMNSRHLTGHAIDVVAYVGGRVSWEFELYEQIASAFEQASAELGIPCEWGGNFSRLKDGAHFQLPYDYAR